MGKKSGIRKLERNRLPSVWTNFFNITTPFQYQPLTPLAPPPFLCLVTTPSSRAQSTHSTSPADADAHVVAPRRSHRRRRLPRPMASCGGHARHLVRRCKVRRPINLYQSRNALACRACSLFIKEAAHSPKEGFVTAQRAKAMAEAKHPKNWKELGHANPMRDIFVEKLVRLLRNCEAFFQLDPLANRSRFFCLESHPLIRWLSGSQHLSG